MTEAVRANTLRAGLLAVRMLGVAAFAVFATALPVAADGPSAGAQSTQQTSGSTAPSDKQGSRTTTAAGTAASDQRGPSKVASTTIQAKDQLTATSSIASGQAGNNGAGQPVPSSPSSPSSPSGLNQANQNAAGQSGQAGTSVTSQLGGSSKSLSDVPGTSRGNGQAADSGEGSTKVDNLGHSKSDSAPGQGPKGASTGTLPLPLALVLNCASATDQKNGQAASGACASGKDLDTDAVALPPAAAAPSCSYDSAQATPAVGCRKAGEAPDAPLALLLPAACGLVLLGRARLSKRGQARRAS